MENQNKQLQTESKTPLTSIILSENKRDLIDFCNNYTPLKCVQESTEQLSKLKRERGEKETVRQVMYLLDWLNSAYKNNLSDDMLYEAAMSIITDYWFFKIEDIALFCSMFRKGQLIKINYHLELQHIFEGLKAYDRLRASEIQKEHENNKYLGAEARKPEYNEVERLKSITDKMFEKK